MSGLDSFREREPAYLTRYGRDIASDAIRSLRQEREAKLAAPELEPMRQALARAPRGPAERLSLDGPVVVIGDEAELDEAGRAARDEILQVFQPWKKGPFSYYGTTIDSEWRSDLKWQRLVPHVDSLKGRRIADIGCHNGYFMYRMAYHNPELVIGFEPVAKHRLAFELLQQGARREELEFEMLGVEHIDLYPRFFDVIFCLGILYHHTDPVGLLRKMHSALRPGGQLVIDCQGIAGNEPWALTPRGRYAGAKGIWFLPTAVALEHWLSRASFRDVRTVYQGALTAEEQRTTAWAPIKSLADFLTADGSATIEGYPPPERIYMTARR